MYSEKGVMIMQHHIIILVTGKLCFFSSLLCYAPMPVSLTYYSQPKKPIMLNQMLIMVNYILYHRLFAQSVQ